jgi:hypothetical protein
MDSVMSRFAGAASARTDEWLTAPATHAALGGWRAFDLDPAAMVGQPWPTARHHYTRHDNGLLLRWNGDIYLNPPYVRGLLGRFMARMASHGRGIALIFARTDTEVFHAYVWGAASALLFLRGRQRFCLPSGRPALRSDGKPADAGAPSVLCAYGQKHADVLAGCGLDGEFVPLRLARSVVVAALDRTWCAIILEFVRDRRRPVHLAELYRYAAAQPRAARNRNTDAKVRQVLREGPFREVGNKQWSAA